MVKSDLKKFIILLLLAFLSACAKNRIPDTIVAEEGMVWNCRYLDTVSEISDPGKVIFPLKFSSPYGAERKVLERSRNMGASHIVWMYNYPVGSSAAVYRCDD